MELFWTSKKRINGLKHFVVINQYKLKKEAYLDFVSALDESINFKISKKAFEDSNQWIKGWNNNEKEKIDFKEYQKFKSEISRDNLNKISLSQTSQFNIS